MGHDQLERLMILLRKLEARDSGDPAAIEERNHRVTSFDMPDFNGQEHNDAKTLVSMGWIINPQPFGTNIANSWSSEGIYAFNLTEDGKAALETWRQSSAGIQETVATQTNARQDTRPQVMVIHGSRNGKIPPIVDEIRLWCYDQGLDARKAIDHPDSGRFIHEESGRCNQ